MLGTGPFAAPTLKALVASPHDVALVVTRPPRGREPAASPLARAAEELGLRIWSPDSVNIADSQARLLSLAADLLVVCDYGEILKSETLAATRLGGINLHGSLLPKYRGAAPVQTAILRGETETGNSVIQMTPGLDAGPCLGQDRLQIDPDEDAQELESRLAAQGAALVLQVVDQLAAGTAQPVPQDKAQASKAPRLTKEQGAIDWSRPAAEIKNLVRAVRPWPRAYTFLFRTGAPPLRLNVDRVALARTALAVRAHTDSALLPGAVLHADQELLIATGDGVLELLELQPAGKKSMSAGDFLRGYRIQDGDRFGPE
jgi:methionyl-tRNA formyltransferase